MKRYLITGFSGFVGYYFLKFLDSTASEKIEVLGIDLALPPDFESEYNFKNLIIRFVSINLMDFKALEIAVTSFSPDYILHLASLSSVSASWVKPVDCFMNNTNIFLNLVDIVRLNKIDCRILSIGSSEEYGNVSADDVPLVENRILEPISPYAIARVSQEMISKCYVDSFGLDIVLTRSFNHMGPRQRDVFVIPSFVKQIVQGKLEGQKEIVLHTGNVDIVRDFLDVRDVVRAYDLLLKGGKAGELYNVCSGKGNALKDIINIISKIAGIPVKIEIDSSRVRPNDNMIIIGSNEKISLQTGWKVEHTLEDTIKDMIQYWTSELTK